MDHPEDQDSVLADFPVKPASNGTPAQSLVNIN
jgi:hypothetical protein